MVLGGYQQNLYLTWQIHEMTSQPDQLTPFRVGARVVDGTTEELLTVVVVVDTLVDFRVTGTVV